MNTKYAVYQFKNIYIFYKFESKARLVRGCEIKKFTLINAVKLLYVFNK